MTEPSLWLAIGRDGRVKYTTDRQRSAAWQASNEYRVVRDYYTKPQPVIDDISDRFTHRLAVMLECAVLDPNGTFNDACALLDEYRKALRQRDEAMGIPYVSGFGKD